MRAAGGGGGGGLGGGEAGARQERARACSRQRQRWRGAPVAAAALRPPAAAAAAAAGSGRSPESQPTMMSPLRGHTHTSLMSASPGSMLVKPSPLSASHTCRHPTTQAQAWRSQGCACRASARGIGRCRAAGLGAARLPAVLSEFARASRGGVHIKPGCPDFAPARSCLDLHQAAACPALGHRNDPPCQPGSPHPP